MVEPSDSQECKDFLKTAYEISEKFDIPVLFRMTTRVCHSKSLVEFADPCESKVLEYKRNVRKYVAAPANAKLNHPILEQKLLEMAEYACTSPLNRMEINGSKIGVITASIAYQYAKEAFPEDTSFLKLGMTFPLPMKLIRAFAEKVEKLYIVEELDPFMEEQIKAAAFPVLAKTSFRICSNSIPRSWRNGFSARRPKQRKPPSKRWPGHRPCAPDVRTAASSTPCPRATTM